MRGNGLRYAVSVPALILALFLASTGVTFAKVELLVSAAASLKEALTEIQTRYEQQNPAVTLTLNFGASGALQHQIEQGAPADIFLSAAVKPVDALEKQNLLVAGSRHIFARNTLVLIAPADAKIPAQLSDLAAPAVTKIALGEPASVPAGDYAKTALTALKLWPNLETKVIYAKDVRQVLTYVESGNVEAGFVYASDARSSKRVRLVTVIPPEMYPVITYPGAIVAASKNQAAAQAFLDFLHSAAAKEILARFGFIQEA